MNNDEMVRPSQYSAFTHLARSVLGARYHREETLFAMMTCYFDESIEKWADDEDGAPRKFIFVCGYVASVEQWEKFEIEWKKFLADYEVSDFHMTDYCYGSEEYKKWPVNDPKFAPIRERFIQDASRIVCKFARYGFVSAISETIFRHVNKSYRLEESFGSPYGLVGRECANLARSRRSKFYADKNDFKYVFEDGGPDKCGLLRAMTGLGPSFPDPIFEPGKNWKPSQKYPDGRKAVVQLQAADYLAYEVRKFFNDQIKVKPIRDIRLSFEAITGIDMAKRLFTVKELESTCDDLQIQRR